MSSRKRKADKQGRIEDGFFCFAVESQVPQQRQRSRYSNPRREEVRQVRKKRACLRCRLLKIPCSGGDPCSTCLRLTMVHQQKKALSFSYCIRTSLKDVSIFEQGLPSLSQRDLIAAIAADLAASYITLSFESHITWTLNTLSSDIVEWLNASGDSTTSKVGTLSSPTFQNLIIPSIGPQGCSDFQQMLYAQSLAYTRNTTSSINYFGFKELQQVSAVAGHSFLLELDRKLTPSHFASCSQEGLAALFLVIFGTILAVGYASPAVYSPPFPMQDDDLNRVPRSLYTVMQEHLCQTLAHYLVYLASKLGLSVPENTEKILVDAAHIRWKKEGRFSWSFRLVGNDHGHQDNPGLNNVESTHVQCLSQVSALSRTRIGDLKLDPYADFPVGECIQPQKDAHHLKLPHLSPGFSGTLGGGLCSMNPVIRENLDINDSTFETRPLGQGDDAPKHVSFDESDLGFSVSRLRIPKYIPMLFDNSLKRPGWGFPSDNNPLPWNSPDPIPQQSSLRRDMSGKQVETYLSYPRARRYICLWTLCGARFMYQKDLARHEGTHYSSSSYGFHDGIILPKMHTPVEFNLRSGGIGNERRAAIAAPRRRPACVVCSRYSFACEDSIAHICISCQKLGTMNWGCDNCHSLRRVCEYKRSRIKIGDSSPTDTLNSREEGGTEMFRPACNCRPAPYTDIFLEQEHEPDYEVQWHGNLLV